MHAFIDCNLRLWYIALRVPMYSISFGLRRGDSAPSMAEIGEELCLFMLVSKRSMLAEQHRAFVGDHVALCC